MWSEQERAQQDLMNRMMQQQANAVHSNQYLAGLANALKSYGNQRPKRKDESKPIRQWSEVAKRELFRQLWSK